MVLNSAVAAMLVVVVAMEGAVGSPLPPLPPPDDYLRLCCPDGRYNTAGSLAGLARSVSSGLEEDAQIQQQRPLSDAQDYFDRYADGGRPIPLQDNDYVDALTAAASSLARNDIPSNNNINAAIDDSGLDITKRGSLLSSMGGAGLGGSSGLSSTISTIPSRSLIGSSANNNWSRGRGLSLSIDASMKVLRQALLIKSAMLKQRQQMSRARQNHEYLQTIGKRSIQDQDSSDGQAQKRQ